MSEKMKIVSLIFNGRNYQIVWLASSQLNKDISEINVLLRYKDKVCKNTFK